MEIVADEYECILIKALGLAILVVINQKENQMLKFVSIYFRCGTFKKFTCHMGSLSLMPFSELNCCNIDQLSIGGRMGCGKPSAAFLIDIAGERDLGVGTGMFQ